MTDQTIEITPPPFVERFEYKSLKQINDPVTRKRVYLTPDDEKLPSVTTILSSTKDMTHLIEWRKRVGEENARRITTEAAGVGTAMHNNLERFVVGEKRQPGNNPVHVQANKMADVIIENGLKHVDEIWSIEQALYFPGLYSGTTDLCGMYKGQPAIMDHKQTNKPKKLEWVVDYFLQLTAYAEAHNELYGTDIREGHVFMCSRAGEYQQFDIWPNEYDEWRTEWYNRVYTYYEQHG